jgi:hypothetical protein
MSRVKKPSLWEVGLDLLEESIILDCGRRRWRRIEEKEHAGTRTTTQGEIERGRTVEELENKHLR